MGFLFIRLKYLFKTAGSNSNSKSKKGINLIFNFLDDLDEISLAFD